MFSDYFAFIYEFNRFHFSVNIDDYKPAIFIGFEKCQVAAYSIENLFQNLFPVIFYFYAIFFRDGIIVSNKIYFIIKLHCLGRKKYIYFTTFLYSQSGNIISDRFQLRQNLYVLIDFVYIGKK